MRVNTRMRVVVLVEFKILGVGSVPLPEGRSLRVSDAAPQTVIQSTKHTKVVLPY